MASGAWRIALIWRREDSRQGSCGSTDTRSRRSCAEPEAGRLRRKAGRGGREPDGVRRSTDGANQVGEGPSSETRFEAHGASAFEFFRRFDGEGEWEYETTRFLVDEAAAARIGEILRFGAPAAVGGTGSRSSRIAAD